MEDWLDLINAETEGDLMEIQNKSTIPEVHETIVKLRELSADEKLKRDAYYREKRLHDEASAIIGSRREGRAEGLAEGLAEGRAEGRAEERNAIIESMRKNGFTDEQIVNALKDALAKGKKSLNSVDKILLSYQIRDDRTSEGMSPITKDWNKNLEETIRIAKTPWLDDDK